MSLVGKTWALLVVWDSTVRRWRCSYDRCDDGGRVLYGSWWRFIWSVSW